MNLKSQVQGAYNAENRKCIFNEMYGISVRTNYEPRYFVKYTVNTADRYNFRIYVNAEYLHDIPFRNLSTTDKVMVVKAFVNDFGSED